MELRDAIKVLREELGVTQTELATALHMTSLTISRWELGKSKPNRAVSSLLLGYAYTHGVKRDTIDTLKVALAEASKKANKTNIYAGMMATEHSSLSECFDVAPFAVYVCDIETDMMLYANKLALKMLECEPQSIAEQKCYKCLMHTDTPCEFCHKRSLSKDKFTSYKTAENYLVHGKLTRWNGHDAQIRIITVIGGENET